MSSQMGEIIDGLQGGSRASYALRFVAEHPNVIMILSGMGSMEMMMDNISTMKDPQPLSETEREALKKAAAVYWGTEQIPCTGCRYCAEGCPQQIPIPDIFAAANEEKNTGVPGDFDSIPGGKAADCVHCRKCEMACPQHLPIRPLLQRVTKKKV
jgi:predicted aldo/keto reductase-like oxidoreductase